MHEWVFLLIYQAGWHRRRMIITLVPADQLLRQEFFLSQISKQERNDTMKEKELESRRGDVDDMIFGSEAYVSER